MYVCVCIPLCDYVSISLCVYIRVAVVDCGDKASDWLSSFLNIENIRLVRYHQSRDARPLVDDAKPNTAESLFQVCHCRCRILSPLIWWENHGNTTVALLLLVQSVSESKSLSWLSSNATS